MSANTNANKRDNYEGDDCQRCEERNLECLPADGRKDCANCAKQKKPEVSQACNSA